MIANIESAIVNRISAANEAEALGYKLKSVTTYGGELDEQINQVIRSLPAVWVIFNGQSKKRSYNGGGRIEWDIRFSVMCGAKSLRNEANTRHGSGDSVGSYQIVKDVTALLCGQKLGLPIAALMPERVFALSNNRSDRDLASIYVVEFVTSYTADFGVDVDDLDDFETFHADWDIPVFGNVGENLPAETPDAADTVILEQDNG